jgi:F-type H+-transporting ATPase subunit gamma
MLEYIFEPSPQAVLDFMLPYYVQYQVFQMILDARASEHSARMVAMKNATDNANQFIKDLTLEYNKMRQASITTELLESQPPRWRLAARSGTASPGFTPPKE